MRDRVTELRRVRAGDLEVHPSNWRGHPEPQAAALRGILEEVGWAAALVAYPHNGSLRLIDGHLRAGIDPDEEVPVLILDVDDEEADKLLVSLDPISAMARAEPEKLRALLDSVKVSDEGLGAMLTDLSKLATKPGGEVGPVLKPPADPVTKPGDLYQLGRHRLLCGDATSSDDVELLLGEAVPNLMVTDPPYGVNYEPNWRAEEAAKGNLAYAPSRVGQVSNDDSSEWGAAYALFRGSVIYSWSPAGTNSYDFHQAICGAGFDIRMQIIWAKRHFPIGRGHYHVRHEPCWYAVRHGSDASWVGDRKQTTVWDDITLDANVEGGHGTQKPVECMGRPIRNHAGDVYDSFVGSGTTLIACEQENRTCYAMDIDPAYCDVAVARWEKYTGQRAELQ